MLPVQLKFPTQSRRAGRPSRARLRVEGLEDRATPAILNVTPTATPTPADNDYTRIQAAVNSAADGDTIMLAGTFNFTEANAAASWARGSDGTAGTFDDFSVYVPDGLTGVTFTATALGAASIQGPGDLPQLDLESFLYFDGDNYQDWTVSNLDIRDFDMGLGFFAGVAGAFDNLTVTGNRIRLAADRNGVVSPNDALQNIGVHYSYGLNQSLTNNEIQIPGNGTTHSSATEGDLFANPERFASSVGFESTTGGGVEYDGLTVSGNIVRVLDAQSAFPERVTGYWENGHTENSDITFANNQFVNTVAGNDPLLNRQQAFWVTSHSSAGTTVAYTGNTVEGAALGFRFLSESDFTGQDAIRFIDNTLTGVRDGFLVQSNGSAYLSGNTVTGVGADAGGTGVLVRGGSRVDADDAVGTNTLTGFASGFLVQGQAAIAGATVTGNGVGIRANSGTVSVQTTDLRNNTTAGLLVQDGAIVDAGQVDTPTYDPVDFTNLGISSGQNNFAAGYSAAGAQAIVNANTGANYNTPGPDGLPRDLTAQGNFFFSTAASFIETVVLHDADDPTRGFVDYASAVTQSDLVVTADFVTNPAFVGQQLTLLVRVTNFGPSEADDVTASVPVPAGTTFVSAATSHGTTTVFLGSVIADIGTLQQGETAVVRIVVQPTAAGTASTTATVTSSAVEPVDGTANNTDAASVPVLANQGGVVRLVRGSTGRLALTGDASANAVQIVANGATANSFRVLGLGGTQVRFGSTTGTSVVVNGVIGGISANLGAATDTLIVDGSGTNAPLAVRGLISMASGAAANTGDDVFYALHLTGTTGGVTFTGGPGHNRAEVSESTFATSLNWRGGPGNDTLTVTDVGLIGNGRTTGNFTAVAGGGNDTLTATDLSVGRAFSWNGGLGTDTVTLTDASVVGNFNLPGVVGLDGPDVTTLATLFVGGTFTWAGGAGNDNLAVTDATFSKAFAARAGIGDDSVSVARSRFLAAATFDGWSGVDQLDAGTNSTPVGSSRGNEFAVAPRVLRFETVL
jgi:uncharacterized repeat protein (TIGR01451 family)